MDSILPFLRVRVRSIWALRAWHTENIYVVALMQNDKKKWSNQMWKANRVWISPEIFMYCVWCTRLRARARAHWITETRKNLRKFWARWERQRNATKAVVAVSLFRHTHTIGHGKKTPRLKRTQNARANWTTAENTSESATDYDKNKSIAENKQKTNTLIRNSIPSVCCRFAEAKEKNGAPHCDNGTRCGSIVKGDK